MKLGIFTMGRTLALLARTLTGCDDRLKVRQAYDSLLSSWYLQGDIMPDNTVEIRLVFNRRGDYREVHCHIGYIQLEGDDEISGTDDAGLISHELTDLSGIVGLGTTDIRRQVLTLFYGGTGKDDSGIRFMAMNSFFVGRTLDIPFSIKDEINTGTVK